jgi:hypothetical protein
MVARMASAARMAGAAALALLLPLCDAISTANVLYATDQVGWCIRHACAGPAGPRAGCQLQRIQRDIAIGSRARAH